ncbi:TauD/TfdA dioxygenase family protein [Piscinibacter sakaiensis]|uniref:TauD/TfdA dioxygenase family protein n=1 Tax=Piscinibacter sakaiensis TaxID=1547922 RepID=UPI003AAD14E7
MDDHKSLPRYRLAEQPEIFLITNKQVGGKPSETKETGRLWRSDHSFTTHPTMASALYCREIPAIGGDAWRRCMTSAVMCRSELTTRSRWRRWSASTRQWPNQWCACTPKRAKALYVSEALSFRFVGMTEEESRGLMRYLWQHSIRPESLYRHNWKVGDLLLWDNRCTMHMVSADYAPGQPRLMDRTRSWALRAGACTRKIQAPR